MNLWSNFKFEEWKDKQRGNIEFIQCEEAQIVTSRRELIRETKEVKSLPEDEQAAKLPELLKIYQKEIDYLCNRVKCAHLLIRESTSPLLELPEPSQEGNSELIVIRKENMDLRKALETASIGHQKLVVKLQGLSEMESRVHQAQVDLKEREDLLDKVNMAFSEQEGLAMVATNRSEELRIEFSRLQKAYEELQKEYEAATGTNRQVNSVSEAELELLSMDLENWRRQCLDLQRENELLKVDLETAKNGSTKGPVDSNRRLTELEEDILDLQIKLEQVTKEATTKNIKIKELTGKLDSYADVKADLTFLKGEKFPGIYDENLDQSCVTLLQQKCEKLEHELSQFQSQPLTSASTANVTSPRTEENSRLQKENSKLLERIKLLETLNNKTSTAKEQVDAELGEYFQNEDRFDPFKIFFQNEVVKRFKDLGSTDRTMWKVGKVFMTRKFLRRAIMTYFVLLHVAILYFLIFRTGTPVILASH